MITPSNTFTCSLQGDEKCGDKSLKEENEEIERESERKREEKIR